MLDDERKVGRRNGLYAARAIAAGSELGAGDIVLRRPAVGIDERYARAVVGTKAGEAIAEGEANRWSYLEFCRPRTRRRTAGKQSSCYLRPRRHRITCPVPVPATQRNR